MSEAYKHIYKVDLKQPLKRFDVGDILASGDEKANTFEVSIFRDGAEVNLAGVAVRGYFIRPNDETLTVEGSASGNTARLELSKSCYVYDGTFSLAIKVNGNAITQTIAIFDGRIVRTSSENIVDGDRVFYGLDDLLAQITATENATNNANEAAETANTAAENADASAAGANKWANAEANATVLSYDSNPTVNVSEAEGKKVLSFGIPAGKTPDITFNVTTGEPGTQVQLEQSGTPEAPVINLTIPRGDTGAVDGIDYFAGSPSALGNASPGNANGVARGDHVHPMPSAADVGALAVDGTAADSEKLGGFAANNYARKTEIFPIGYIYMSVNETDPSTLFGGTWERIKDRFLLAAGDNYVAGTTGGTETHAHGLSDGYAQIRVASGGTMLSKDKGSASWQSDRTTTGLEAPNASTTSASVGTALGGKTESESNMPPYLAVYMWVRVG